MKVWCLGDVEGQLQVPVLVRDWQHTHFIVDLSGDMSPAVAQVLAWMVASSCKHMRSKIGQERTALRVVRAYVWVQGQWDSRSMVDWSARRQGEAARAFGKGDKGRARCGTPLALAWACLMQC